MAKKKGGQSPKKATKNSSKQSTAPDSGRSSPGKPSQVDNRDESTASQQPTTPSADDSEASLDMSVVSDGPEKAPQDDAFTALDSNKGPLPPLPGPTKTLSPSMASVASISSSSQITNSHSAREMSNGSLVRSASSSSTIHEMDGKAQNIVVAVRIRPAKLGCTDAIWTVADNTIKLSPNHPLIKARGSSSRAAEDAYTFRFDSVLEPTQTTRDLYQDKVAPAVQAAMDGFNSTIFAYGQTGSGKTHTMMGTEGDPGIVHQAVQEVFASIQADNSRTYLLRISYLEIYNETLKDLLSPASATDTPLKIREKSRATGTPAAGSKGNTIIYVDPLHEEVVAQPSDVFDALDRGESNRHVGTTDWNLRSSRSHCVFTLTIESALKTPGLPGSTKISQLNLIDLAGSEKMSTGAGDMSERNTEGAHINKSLLALGNVIAKLSSSQKGHIPYRDSKLTRLLQPSLGGNARVAIVCTVSADPAQAAESVSTLKFARNAKQVVTKAERGHVINDQSALIQKYKRELDNLRSKLETQNKAIATAEDSEELLRAKAEHQRQLGQLEDERAKAEEEISEMRQRRLQLSNELQHLTRLLLTGQEAAGENTGPAHTEEAILQAAGPAGSATRQAYSRRISEIGMGLTTPRKQGPAQTSSMRSVSTKVDSLASPRVGSVEKEVELEAAIERLNVAARQKDDTIFRLETENKSIQNRFEFLEQEHAELVGQVAELRAQAEKASAAQEELTAMTADKDQLLKQIQESHALEDQLKSDLAAAQVNLETTTSEGTKFSEVLKEREETIEQLRKELQGIQSMLKERKAELDRVNSKTAATARLLSSLSHSRDQAEGKVLEAEEKTKAATERAECAEEALVLLQQSLIDSRLAWEKKEQQMQAEHAELSEEQQALVVANNALQAEKVKAEEAHRNDKAVLEEMLAASNNKLMKQEEELHRLREARKPALPVTSHGPSVDDLTAKLDALQNSAKSAPTTRLSAAPISQETDRSAVLQRTITEQQAKIEELERTLRQNQHGKGNASRPSTALGHSSSLYRDGTDSPDASADEIERLNQVIDSQRVTIGDLQEDLYQWRKRMQSQRELIQKLQSEGLVSPMDLSPFATPLTSPTRTRMCHTPASSLPSRFQRLELASNKNSVEHSPRDSPTASTASSRDYQLSSPPTTVSDFSAPGSPSSKQRDLGLGILTPSRRPLPGAQNTPKQATLPESPSRSARRKTIESDLARLQDSKAVEKQRTALLTPRTAQMKQKRVLSGIQQRVQAQQRMLEGENVDSRWSGNSSWKA